uniref:Uncharacterized protein n=1 Tax=Arundo donax TaxID=35708 RepID=A0A0A9A8I9_ARUDO
MLFSMKGYFAVFTSNRVMIDQLLACSFGTCRRPHHLCGNYFDGICSVSLPMIWVSKRPLN